MMSSRDRGRAFFFFQAEDGIRDIGVTGVQTCALPISGPWAGQAMPFMEIHGTADPTSLFDGDLTGVGGWGAYLPVRMAVNAMAAHNRCLQVETEEREGLTPTNGHKVTIMRYSGGRNGADVWFYEIKGAVHSWHMADIDTGEEIWKFFSRYLVGVVDE